MNDRELILLAGKAAGKLGDLFYFHPLTNGAHALWLASKLELDVYCHESGAMVCCSDIKECINEKGSDPYAATLRAIVLCAAEIGRKI